MLKQGIDHRRSEGRAAHFGANCRITRHLCPQTHVPQRNRVKAQLMRQSHAAQGFWQLPATFEETNHDLTGTRPDPFLSVRRVTTAPEHCSRDSAIAAANLGQA
jgi:hypothetical protein